MKVFLKKTILILLLGYSIIFMLNYALYKHYTNTIAWKLDNIDEATASNTEVIFAGSSRCWYHFDPELFKANFNLNGINMGLRGYPQIEVAFYRLKTYINETKKAPKFVILAFDARTKVDPESYKTYLDRKNRFSINSTIPFNKNASFNKESSNALLERVVPLYGFLKYENLDDYIDLDKNPYARVGYGKVEGDGFNLQRGMNLDEGWDVYYKDHQKFNQIHTALKDFNEYCKAKNIKLICVGTPVYKDIYDPKSFEVSREICEELNIDYIDANIESIRNEKSNFFDPIHLNFKGVSKLSTYLSHNKSFTALLSKS
ncbi:hypothetical protein [Formosa sp. S-31]|uniref:hypothetical protein n=1 Tax=Formosa sp. S-31 TaxID=2790949 RepID=UPI003EBA97BB